MELKPESSSSVCPAASIGRDCRQWGILSFSRSQEEYHRWLDHYYTEIELTPAAEDGEGTAHGIVGELASSSTECPEDFLQKVTFDLTSEEAEYLTDRIRLSRWR